jgi:hypothetical protein
MASRSLGGEGADRAGSTPAIGSRGPIRWSELSIAMIIHKTEDGSTASDVQKPQRAWGKPGLRVRLACDR